MLFLLKGDLDYYAKCLGLRHYASNSPCDLCRANRDPLSSLRYNNFRSDAEWKTSLISHGEWRAMFPNAHMIFQRSPFLSNRNLEPGLLHAMHLGTSQYFAGCILWSLCYKHMAGAPSANMAEIWEQIVDYDRAHDTTCVFSNLKLSSFCDPLKPRANFPKLKGKGAETKHLIAALSSAWDRFANRAGPDYALVRKCLDAQLAVHQVLDDHREDMFIPLAAAARLKKFVDIFLHHYTMLAGNSDAVNELLWSVVPKHHWLYHLSRRAEWLNPRCGDTSIDEDFLGKLKGIVTSCSAGSSLRLIGDKALSKYRWGLHFELM